MKRIPVNVISGPLGVGKTTAIHHLLENRPQGERWAVLVNEYGLVGLDAALLSDAARPDGIDIREVAGGCICCSAGFLFEVSLGLLLEQGPDRLLIEPTGLAALSGILDSLDREPVRSRVDVRSTLCLLDPATAERDRQREEVADQIEAADVLLANRCDLASVGHLEAFSAWEQTLFPRKQHVAFIEQGRVAASLLDLVSDRQVAASRTDYRHGTDHQDPTEHRHPVDTGEERSGTPVAEALECGASQPIVRRCHLSPVTSTIGWICWKELIFDLEKVVYFFAKLRRSLDAQRIKAVLRTDDGWWSFNFTPTARNARPTAYRRDSRIEAIVEGDTVGDLDALEEALRQSLLREHD